MRESQYIKAAIAAAALAITAATGYSQDYDLLEQTQRQQELEQQRLEAYQRQQEIIQQMRWQELRDQQRQEEIIEEMRAEEMREQLELRKAIRREIDDDYYASPLDLD